MRAICFDLDGTLTDPKTGITRSIQHALVELTGEAPDAENLTWCIGPPLQQSFQTILGSKHLAGHALELYRKRFGEIGLFENEIIPGIPELLAKLKEQQYRLFIATSKPVVFAQKIADHFCLSDYFDEIYGAELDGTRSDKTDLLRHVVNSEKIAPSRSVMIGDRRHDIRGANNVKMHSIGVLYGYGDAHELTNENATILVQEPNAIPAAISTIFG